MTWQFLALLLSLVFLVGCGDHESDSIKSQKNEFNFGNAINQSIKIYLSQTPDAKIKLRAYTPHEPGVVTGINYTVEFQDRNTSDAAIEQQILRALYHLVENNTLPQMTNACGKLILEISDDARTVEALSDLMNSRNGADFSCVMSLLHTLLSYEKAEDVGYALVQIIQQNPAVLKHIVGLLHSSISNLPEDESTEKLFAFLTKNVHHWEQSLGTPVWLARLDKNNNPSVQIYDGVMPKPFVDKDADGICDINSQGHPISETDTILDIPAFSHTSYYDTHGNLLIGRDTALRAITPDGRLVFHYYDSKTTLFSVILYEVGLAFQAKIPDAGLAFLNPALGKKVCYKDAQGEYWGCSLDSPGIKGILSILDMFKKQEVHLLLQGGATLLQEQDPEAIQQALQGFLGMVLHELRDNPNIQNVNDLATWFEGFANNPPEEIFPLLQLMYMTPMPEPYQNMAMVLFYFISNDYPQLADNVWPLIQMLRDIKTTHPGLTEKLIGSILRWYPWVLTTKIDISTQPDVQQLQNVASYVLSSFTEKLLENPEEYVDSAKRYLQEILPSRNFSNFMICINNFSLYPIFKETIIAFLDPNHSCGIYDELVRVCVGIMQCRQDVVTNIRLIKFLAKFIDPSLPLMDNLLLAFKELALADQNLAILKIARNVLAPFEPYKAAPIALFSRAYVAVLQASQTNYNSKISSSDVECFLRNISDVLLNTDGLVQKVYRVIQKNASKY